MTELVDCLKVPESLRTVPLVAALVPWKLTVDQYKEHEWQRSHDALNPEDYHVDPKLVEKLDGSQLAAKPLYAQGLRIHHFTIADYEFFTRSPRAYCVWHAPADGTSAEPGFDTRSLLAVMETWKAHKVDLPLRGNNPRVIFVHVGALKTFYKFDTLAALRRKRQEIRFYSYGTHQTIAPERWGLREIYPIGR